MLILEILSLFSLQADSTDPYTRLADRVALPSEEEFAPWAKKSKHHAVVCKQLANREMWRNAFVAIDRALGHRQADLSVRVELGADDGQEGIKTLAQAVGKDLIRFHMDRLADNQKNIEQSDKKRGRSNVVFISGPVTLESTVAHELVHLYMFNTGLFGPGWFTEGMAVWVESTDSHMKYYAYKQWPVERLDAEISVERAYGRGVLFWAWLRETSGQEGIESLVRKVCVDRGDPLGAVDAVSGLERLQWMEKEMAWSRVHIRSIRKKMGR